MNDDAGNVQEFLVESHENLDQLGRDLVELERSPGSHDLLSSVFRTIHTIKGTSGFLAFQRLESLTHVGEHLLSQLRDGKMTLDTEVAGALLRMVDAVRALLEAVERTGLDTDLGVPVEAVVVELHAVLDRVARGAEAGDHAVLTVDTETDLTVGAEITPTIEERLEEYLESSEPLEDDEVAAEFVAVPTAEDTSASTQNDPAPAGVDPTRPAGAGAQADDVAAEFVAVPTAEDTSASTQNDPAPAGVDPPGRPVRGRKPTTWRPNSWQFQPRRTPVPPPRTTPRRPASTPSAGRCGGASRRRGGGGATRRRRPLGPRRHLACAGRTAPRRRGQ